MARNPKSTTKDKTASKPEGPSIGAIESEEQIVFRYLVKGERVRRDGAFFELLLARVVLEPGAMDNFDELWPRGTQALAGLNLRHLSKQSVKDMAGLVNSVGGAFTERLSNRTRDLVVWATAFWEITQVYGSFRQYVRSFDPDGPEVLIEDLAKRMAGLTPKFLVAYLRESGEKIPTLAQFEQPEETARHQGRSRGPNRRRAGRGPGRGRPRDNNGPQKQPKEAAKPAKPAQADSKPNEKATASDAGNGNRQRRGRRGFFRKRRGGRGKKPQAQQDKQQSGQQ